MTQPWTLNQLPLTQTQITQTQTTQRNQMTQSQLTQTLNQLREYEGCLKVIAIAVSCTESEQLPLNEMFEWYESHLRPLLFAESQVLFSELSTECVEMFHIHLTILKSRILLFISRCYFRFAMEKRQSIVSMFFFLFFFFFFHFFFSFFLSSFYFL
jgi:hypothetical protein